MKNYESLVKAIKQVDVVISTVGAAQVADQTNIIAAVKEAGNIKVGDLEQISSCILSFCKKTLILFFDISEEFNETFSQKEIS